MENKFGLRNATYVNWDVSNKYKFPFSMEREYTISSLEIDNTKLAFNKRVKSFGKVNNESSVQSTRGYDFKKIIGTNYFLIQAMPHDYGLNFILDENTGFFKRYLGCDLVAQLSKLYPDFMKSQKKQIRNKNSKTYILLPGENNDINHLMDTYIDLYNQNLRTKQK